MAGISRGWFALALVVALGWLIWLLAPIMTPFAVSFALAYLSDPVIDRLENLRVGGWRFGRTLGVVLVFLAMALLFALFLLILVPLLIEQVRDLIERFPAFLDWLSETALPWLAGQFGFALEDVDTGQLSELFKAYWRELGTATFSVLETLGRGGRAAVTVIGNLVLIPVVTFYLMRDWDRFVAGVRNLIPRSWVGPVSGVAGEIDSVLSSFLRGQFLVMLSLGAIYSVGLWLVGIDFAFLIGLGAGLLSIVPYLGSIVGLAVAVGMALYQFGDLFHFAMVLVVFAVGQSLEGMVLTPKLVGDSIGLHPVTVIFAVLAGGQLFGFLGILLALPVAAALSVVVRHASDIYQGSAWYLDSESGGSS